MKSYDILQVDIDASEIEIEKAYYEKLEHLQSLTVENEDERMLLERKIGDLEKAKNTCLTYSKSSSLEKSIMKLKDTVNDRNTLYSCQLPGLGWCAAKVLQTCCTDCFGCKEENLYEDCGKAPGVSEEMQDPNIFHILDIVGWIVLVVLGFIFIPNWISDLKANKEIKKLQKEKNQQARNVEIQQKLAEENAKQLAQQKAQIQGQKNIIQKNLDSLNQAYLLLRKREQDVLLTMKIIVAVTDSQQLNRIIDTYRDSIQADKKKIYTDIKAMIDTETYQTFENEFSSKYSEMMKYFEFIK